MQWVLTLQTTEPMIVAAKPKLRRFKGSKQKSFTKEQREEK